jgi:nucleotide-binding universal stress UspA family protein
VHLLNVQPSRDDYGMVRAYLSEKKHRAQAIAYARDLLRPVTKRAGRADVTSREHVALGDPAAEIVLAARRLKCQSIVMGSRGMGAIRSMLLGSVATKVSHLARVPVTLVR